VTKNAHDGGKALNRVRIGIILVGFVICLFLPPAGVAEEVKPGPRDKCPVCGMFVAKYPDWVTAILFRDGSRVFFDGAKDMFTYYLDMKRFNPSKSPSDVARVLVTDYYSLAPVDGFEARYVVGSDVFGPMGRELIPFGDDKGAQEFLRDHKGKRIIRFKQVDRPLLRTLE
jgi:copper chaperone NosL